MSVAAASDFDTQLVRGIQTALRQARGLGYHVETMDITASVADGVSHIHFLPIPALGTIQRSRAGSRLPFGDGDAIRSDGG